MKLFLLFTLLYIPLYAQISPGDLTKYHAGLEGLSNCTKCHVIGEQVTNAKCLNCHKEIKELQTSSRGYHSSSEVKGKNCWSCHSEHHGRNFRIINFNRNSFDHNKTGYKLTGSHAGTECSNCHKKDFLKNPLVKKRKDTYLGLDAKCISCHEDFHQGTLKQDCASCHNTEKFRPAEGFNHDKASFRLTGSHEKTDCVKCHVKEKRGGKNFQRFKGIAFASCSSCHKDVHQGKFGSDCKSCHSTVSFNEINRTAFNHDKTNYPLIGKHRSVQCQSCHKTDLNSKPKYEKCTDCHKDFHKGQFISNNIVKDCKYCHSEKGFTPSSYSLNEHNKSKFQLTGAHLAVPCKNCHYTDNELKFRKVGLNCIDCHKNVHGEELSIKFMPDENCTSCHETAAWSIIKFEHDKTEFPLNGKHSQILCSKCHVRENKYLFASVQSNCEYCHKDVHYGQFKEGQDSNCQRCHTSENWNPVKFDHSKTRFSLEGAHKNVNCTSCHKRTEIIGTSFIKYKLEDFRCSTCHR